ncbi:hypothetical protein B0H16DRAFT_1598241 [Mycena metata]|uniref:SnoaL-like domain-containing protein n=1 Tax=Mycena metata TaxID=1033252 RepID=A0AAD7MLZ3_9AGAR|nr:hypothetical protein B0H16DRAFT_1598241 [Mycena metata]
MSTLDAKQLENAHAFLKHLNAMDWVSLGDLLAPEFKHQCFPATVVVPDGRQTRSKEEYIEGILQGGLTNYFKTFRFSEPMDVIHGSNKVAFHVKSVGVFKSGDSYENEYMLTFHFDGEKVVRLNEFVDSKYTAGFFPTA